MWRRYRVTGTGACGPETLRRPERSELVFKRRNRLSVGEMLLALVYPRGGFRRATQYVVHRMRRLPDEPHRIARGVFAGTFVNFPPIFGIQFASAALIAYGMRGNILAALLCTFLSNPITTPLIAVVSLEMGYFLLGMDQHLDFIAVFAAFADAGAELWRNVKAIFTTAPTRWDKLGSFFRTIYLPYFVGSIIPGLIFSTGAYYATIPLIRAYQKLRRGKLAERIEKRRRMKVAVAQADARTITARGPHPRVDPGTGPDLRADIRKGPGS